jgi:pimeloyl-ACP methyl ester carboxylesterase
VRFTHANLALSHRTIGTGPTPIIAFHGFGRTGHSFTVFEPALGERFTIHAFDLPFHGESPSSSERATTPFEPGELCDYFSAFADHIGTRKFILIGFSLGGRMALSLLETMPERIAHAVLIAPDGLAPRPWYRALASSSWGRARYRSFIERPQRMHGMAKALNRTGLLQDKMHRFIIGHTDTRDKRLFLHDVWLSYRNLEVDLMDVVANLREHGIRLDMVFGEFDTVIRSKPGQKLAAHAPELIHVHKVPLGHQMLTADVAVLVRDLLATAAART